MKCGGRNDELMYYFSVQTGRLHDCYVRRQVQVANDESSGYLSSHVALRTGLGSHACPWHIRAPIGQRINITMYTFFSPPLNVTTTSKITGTLDIVDSLPSVHQEDGGSHGTGTCHQVAAIRESGSSSQRIVTACPHDNFGRQRIVFLSASNHVEVEFIQTSTTSSLTSAESSSILMTSSSDSDNRFLLHYQC